MLTATRILTRGRPDSRGLKEKARSGDRRELTKKASSRDRSAEDHSVHSFISCSGIPRRHKCLHASLSQNKHPVNPYIMWPKKVPKYKHLYFKNAGEREKVLCYILYRCYVVNRTSKFPTDVKTIYIK